MATKISIHFLAQMKPDLRSSCNREVGRVLGPLSTRTQGAKDFPGVQATTDGSRVDCIRCRRLL